jgi:general nucleoside transport system ATP-binding protein
MARMMIGKDLVACRRGAPAAAGEVRLGVRGLTRPAPHAFGVALKDIDLEVRAGEIVGIAGVSGNGQQELLQALSGEAPLRSAPDAIRVDGRPVAHLGCAARRARGLAFVPEERLGRGAVPAMSLADNALLTAHRQQLLHCGFVRRGAVRAFAERCIAQFGVKCSGPDAPANSLSGGNLQKFIVGRELMQRPQVLLAAQPTWGVDVGAAAFIRQSLVALRDAGAAVLVVSEEIDELFEVCDRIAVMSEGRLSPAVATQHTTVETIGLWMSGMWPEAGGAVPRGLADPMEVRHVA